MPKTALMGSPLAVIGTVFRHRRTLAKTGAAVGGVLMLPILFLVMLPGLVFGDLSENTGALTSNTVISENIRASNQAIVEVLQESHDALLAKINAQLGTEYVQIKSAFEAIHRGKYLCNVITYNRAASTYFKRKLINRAIHSAYRE